MARPLLILDLDETLVYACKRPLDVALDFACQDYLIYKRPHLEVFLEACYRDFDVAVWTSSGKYYAECVVSHVFGQRPLEFVWSRERCTFRVDQETATSAWIKNLQKCKRQGYGLERILVVDDTPAKHQLNYGNLVQVSPFEGDPVDDELLDLAVYLQRLATKPDFRKIEKRGWRLRVKTGLYSPSR